MRYCVIFRRLAAVAMTTMIAAAGLGACKTISDITEVVSVAAQPVPAAEDTRTSLLEIICAMEDAMSRGQTELTYNCAEVSDEELQNISDYMSTFWGKPIDYMITSELKDIEGIVPGRRVDVRTITTSFELSNNYYVYDYIRNGAPIPEDKVRAGEIAGELEKIAGAIFPDPEATDYEKTLAAHDWLVANLEYHETPAKSEENGTYGALVLRRTMCQGYAEALELLLKCYTDVEIVQIVGVAKNIIESEFDPAQTDDGDEEAAADESAEAPDGDGAEDDTAPDEGAAEAEAAPEVEWAGHAWNAVRLDGAWYQIDATFDDPIGNKTGHISHFYFGQTDKMMSENHYWERDYFPVSDTGDFLYFRKSGLFAEDWESFQSILTELLTETPIELIEIAETGAAVDGDNIQFVYKVRSDIDVLYWLENTWNDIHVHSIEFYYTD